MKATIGVRDMPYLQWAETAERIESLCKKHGFPAPAMGELLPTAMPKVLALIEHLDQRVAELESTRPREGESDV